MLMSIPAKGGYTSMAGWREHNYSYRKCPNNTRFGEDAMDSLLQQLHRGAHMNVPGSLSSLLAAGMHAWHTHVQQQVSL